MWRCGAVRLRRRRWLCSACRGRRHSRGLRAQWLRGGGARRRRLRRAGGSGFNRARRRGAAACARVRVQRDAATYGGAVWAGAEVSIGAGTTFRLCSAFQGGGVFVQGPGESLAATQATVEGCQATNAGGGVHATLNASIRLDGVAVRGNAAGAYGGGVYIVEGGSLAVLGDSAVQDNQVRIYRLVSR
jgi:hypothetical protein